MGGDTVSALAAQCTVIYKTHPAHPRTTEICNEAIQEAMKEQSLPDGVFQITSPDFPGLELVNHPSIEAVGFTGSFKVGNLITRAASNRPKPIPAYCEMGSVNPIFIFPDALKQNSTDIARGLSESVTLGVGQFCTNPGLVFVVGSSLQVDNFISSFKSFISKVPDAQMLTPSILEAYKTGVDNLRSVKELNCVHYTPATLGNHASPAVFSISITDFLKNPHKYQEEIFGPSTIIVKCSKIAELLAVAKNLEGQLTATFHGTQSDLNDLSTSNLIDQMSEKVGRLVWGGFPTGVEVNHSQHHGGPWPASSDARTTSVGTRAIQRWVRPLAYQTFPEKLLPEVLVQKE